MVYYGELEKYNVYDKVDNEWEEFFLSSHWMKRIMIDGKAILGGSSDQNSSASLRKKLMTVYKSTWEAGPWKIIRKSLRHSLKGT